MSRIRDNCIENIRNGDKIVYMRSPPRVIDTGLVVGSVIVFHKEWHLISGSIKDLSSDSDSDLIKLTELHYRSDLIRMNPDWKSYKNLTFIRDKVVVERRLIVYLKIIKKR